MPSGRTHDSITLWSLPLIAGLTFGQTQSSNFTLLVSGGYLFGGLMFGPDLDIYSRQYKRWGLLRWIWLPYRRGMRHRSFWSHGPVVGTIVRIFYLSIWLGLIGIAVILIGSIGGQLIGTTDDWRLMAEQWRQSCVEFLGQSFQQSSKEWGALAIGLELGSLSHSLSDWAGSAYKQFRRRSRKVSASSGEPSPLPPLLNDLPPLAPPNPSPAKPPVSKSPVSKPPVSRQATPAPPLREPQLPPFKRHPKL